MEQEISLIKDPHEIENALETSHFDCIELYEPISKVEKGGPVYIIPEDEPHYVVPATWALGDEKLESLLEGKKLKKCVILVDKIVQGGKITTQEDELFGIKGYCIDYGGDNYIALPNMSLEESGSKDLQLCNCNDIQEFLIH